MLEGKNRLENRITPILLDSTSGFSLYYIDPINTNDYIWLYFGQDVTRLQLLDPIIISVSLTNEEYYLSRRLVHENSLTESSILPQNFQFETGGHYLFDISFKSNLDNRIGFSNSYSSVYQSGIILIRWKLV